MMKIKNLIKYNVVHVRLGMLLALSVQMQFHNTACVYKYTNNKRFSEEAINADFSHDLWAFRNKPLHYSTVMF